MCKKSSPKQKKKINSCLYFNWEKSRYWENWEHCELILASPPPQSTFPHVSASFFEDRFRAIQTVIWICVSHFWKEPNQMELSCGTGTEIHVSHAHIRRNKALEVNALIQTAVGPAHSDDIRNAQTWGSNHELSKTWHKPGKKTHYKHYKMH